jgi:CheY-like chemotaxis protein
VIDVPSPSLFPVLLVEPDHVDRVLAHSVLASAGFTVIATNNYADALQVLKTRPPLVLVSTVRLGAQNGIDLARQALSERPQLPIVLTSSTPDGVEQCAADRLGATFVLKPVTPEDLLAAIYRTALRQPDSDAGAGPIRPPFERRRADRRVSQARNVTVERRHAGRRRDVKSLLVGLPAAV